MVAGEEYEIEISTSYTAPSASTAQYDIAARVSGFAGDFIDSLAAGLGTAGVPLSGKRIYPATSTGNITITCGVMAGSAVSIRADNYRVSVKRSK